MDVETVRNIEKFGWSAIDIRDSDAPFQYSVGLLQTFHHPEFLLYGLESAVCHAILSALVKQIRQGRSYADDGVGYVELESGSLRVGFRRIHSTQRPLYLGYAMGFARELGVELAAMQVFWPDRDDRLPFEAGCDAGVVNLQQRLDIPLAPSELRRWNRQWE